MIAAVLAPIGADRIRTGVSRLTLDSAVQTALSKSGI